MFLLRLDFSTLIYGSYLGVDGVYYFLHAIDLCIVNDYIYKWIVEGLGYYNRLEVYQFCKVNKISKEYIGIFLKNKIQIDNFKIKEE